MMDAEQVRKKLDQVLHSDRIKLPVMDRTAVYVQQEVQKDHPDMGQIEKLIKYDPALTSEVFRVANSAFYKGYSQIKTLQEAIVRLGLNQLSQIVWIVSLGRMYLASERRTKTLLQHLWEHSIGCAIGSAWLMNRLSRNDLIQEAFVSGLLHDMGKLFLLRVFEDADLSGLPGPDEGDPDLVTVLHDLHTEYGALCMRTWNFPESYALAAQKHHDPEVDAGQVCLQVVRLLNLICNQKGIGLSGGQDLVDPLQTPEARMLHVDQEILDDLRAYLDTTLPFFQGLYTRK
jgi:HD-like signal output (HDOD) protein